MPITPADIQQKTFSEAKRGYQPAEVDVFLEEISKDIDAMLRKIADLKTRLTAAEAQNAELQASAEKARAEANAARAAAAAQPAAPVQQPAVPAADSSKSGIYSATEEQLAAALIVAQQSADRIVAEAKANADRIRVDAETQARKVIRQALDEKQTELDEIERLKVSRENFRTEYLSLIQKFADAAQANFPLMTSTVPSGSEAPLTVAPRSSASVIPTEANPYGAQVESGFDDLD